MRTLARLLLFSALGAAGCGFDIQTPPIRLEFIDKEGRVFRPKEAIEVVVNGRVAKGAAAEVFVTKHFELSATRTVIEPFRLAHESGSDPSLEIVMPDEGEIVSSEDTAYRCRPTLQVTSGRLEATSEQRMRVGCESQPNRIRAAAFVCAPGPTLELEGTFAELRRVAGRAAFTDEIAGTLRAKLRFTDERAPFAEILLRFSRTNVIAGVADAKHIVDAVAYSVPAARGFRFPEVLARLGRGIDAGFRSPENPREEDEVGKVMPKTRCRANECRFRFLWPVIPTDRREVAVQVHLDRAGRRDPEFTITAWPCPMPEEEPGSEEGGGG